MKCLEKARKLACMTLVARRYNRQLIGQTYCKCLAISSFLFAVKIFEFTETEILEFMEIEILEFTKIE